MGLFPRLLLLRIAQHMFVESPESRKQRGPIFFSMEAFGRLLNSLTKLYFQFFAILVVVFIHSGD